MDQMNPASPLYPFVWVDPERMGGEPCFRGSRVPIKNLFDCLQDDQTVEDFLADFPPVTREQAQAVLRLGLNIMMRDVVRAAAA